MKYILICIFCFQFCLSNLVFANESSVLFYGEDKESQQLKNFIEQSKLDEKHNINFQKVELEELDSVNFDSSSCSSSTNLEEDSETCSIVDERENYIKLLKMCGSAQVELPMLVYTKDEEYLCIQGSGDIKNYIQKCEIQDHQGDLGYCSENTTFDLYFTLTCPHCAKVRTYFAQNHIKERFSIEYKELTMNADYAKEFSNMTKECGYKGSGVPFLLIKQGDKKGYILGDGPIISYFQGIDEENIRTNVNLCKSSNGSIFWILLPTALSDSINPCAFAVILILLSSILQKRKSRRAAVFSGLMFVCAIFLSYFLIGFLLVKLLGANVQNAIGNGLKIGIGVLGIILGLFNLKDFFWYGKGFVMEVPRSWRPLMAKTIEGIVSPGGAFVIGLLVSFFLLPCTAGPYVVFSGYLATNGGFYSTISYIFYLVIYNILFVLPMLIIIFVVSFGYKTVSELNEMRKLNLQIIHLIVGLILLFLGIYVLNDVYGFVKLVF